MRENNGNQDKQRSNKRYMADEMGTQKSEKIGGRDRTDPAQGLEHSLENASQ